MYITFETLDGKNQGRIADITEWIHYIHVENSTLLYNIAKDTQHYSISHEITSYSHKVLIETSR